MKLYVRKEVLQFKSIYPAQESKLKLGAALLNIFYRSNIQFVPSVCSLACKLDIAKNVIKIGWQPVFFIYPIKIFCNMSLQTTLGYKITIQLFNIYY